MLGRYIFMLSSTSSYLIRFLVLDSGMIAFGLIPPLCVLATSSRTDLSFKVAPILRECGFYLLGLVVFLVSVSDGQIVTAEAVAILSVYVSYVSLVLWLHGHRWWRRTGNRDNNDYRDRIVREDGEEEEEGVGDGDNQPLLLASPSSRSSSSALPRTATMDRNGYGEQQGLRLNLLGGGNSRGSLPSSSSQQQQINSLNMNGNGSAHGHTSNSSEENEDVEAAEAPLTLRQSRGISSSFDYNEEGDDYYYSHSRGDRQNHYSFDNVSAGLQGAASRGVMCLSRRCYGLSLPLLEALPFKALLARIMPTLLPSSPSLASALARLAVCLCLLAVLASLLVSTCRGLLSLMGPTAAQGTAPMLLGATLLALGSEIPDVVSAVALARSGLQDVALSQAIGSQVINISLGVSYGCCTLFMWMFTFFYLSCVVRLVCQHS